MRARPLKEMRLPVLASRQATHRQQVTANMPSAYMRVKSEMCISDPEDQCERDDTDPYNAAA